MERNTAFLLYLKERDVSRPYRWLNPWQPWGTNGRWVILTRYVHKETKEKEVVTWMTHLRSSFLSFARDGQAGTPRMIMGPVSKNEMNRLTALSPFHFLSDYSFYYRSCSTKKIMDKPFNHKDWNSLVIRILGWTGLWRSLQSFSLPSSLHSFLIRSDVRRESEGRMDATCGMEEGQRNVVDEGISGVHSSFLLSSNGHLPSLS